MCNFVMNHDEYCELPNSKWESNNEVVAFISFEHPYGTQICFVSMERIFYYYHLRLNMTHMTEMKYFHAMYGVESSSWHSKNCESNILSQSHRRVLWLIIREICVGIGYSWQCGRKKHSNKKGGIMQFVITYNNQTQGIGPMQNMHSWSPISHQRGCMTRSDFANYEQQDAP